MEERVKMTIEERARQFAPFAALKGYDEMINGAEVVVSAKKTVDEERAEELSRTVNGLKKGDLVKVVYYDSGKYVSLTGAFVRADVALKTLIVVKTAINFDDIYDIEKV